MAEGPRACPGSRACRTAASGLFGAAFCWPASRDPCPSLLHSPSPRLCSWSSSWASSVLLRRDLESVCGPGSVDRARAFWGVPASPSPPLPVPSLPHSTAGWDGNSRPVHSPSARAGWQPTYHLVPAPWMCPCQAPRACITRPPTPMASGDEPGVVGTARGPCAPAPHPPLPEAAGPAGRYAHAAHAARPPGSRLALQGPLTGNPGFPAAGGRVSCRSSCSLLGALRLRAGED